MATQEQSEMLAGKALLDHQFLDALLNDPQGTANSVGVYLTDAQVARIKSLSYDEREKIRLDVPGFTAGLKSLIW